MKQNEIIRAILADKNVGPIFVATNSRVNGLLMEQISKALEAPIETVSRQTKRIGTFEINEAKNADIGQLVCDLGGVGFTTIDALFTFALNRGFTPPARINNDLKINLLGDGRCSVEIACNPKSEDLIQELKLRGRKGLNSLIIESKIRITTDTPKLARYYFPGANIYELGGKIEPLAKLSNDQLIVGIVDTGNSLQEEGWFRMSTISPQAILLKSQTCLIRRRNDLISYR